MYEFFKGFGLLKEHGNETDFPIFCHKSVGHNSRTQLFGFEFAEILVIKKRVRCLAFNETGSRNKNIK